MHPPTKKVVIAVTRLVMGRAGCENCIAGIFQTAVTRRDESYHESAASAHQHGSMNQRGGAK
jgi:hypothetical protein